MNKKLLSKLARIDRALARGQDEILATGGGVTKDWYADPDANRLFQSIQRSRELIWPHIRKRA